MLPGHGHYRFGGTHIICDEKAHGAEKIKPHEVAVLPAHLKRKSWESSGTVVDSSAYHADLCVFVAIELVCVFPDRQSGKELLECGLIYQLQRWHFCPMPGCPGEVGKESQSPYSRCPLGS